ncbi:MAG TPA: TolC family protein [Gemmataceae bacterium]
MPINTILPGQFRVGLRLIGFLLLSSTLGCSHGWHSYPEGPVERILPPPNLNSPQELPTPQKTVADAAGESHSSEELPSPKKAGADASDDSQDRPAQAKSSPEKDAKDSALPPPSPDGKVSCQPDQPLTLHDAIALAFRLQPRLRASLENIQQARGRQDIVFAAFLPLLTSGYSVGGFNLNAGGTPLQIPGLPNSFNFIPGLGAIPFGLDVKTGYELAEMKLQWLVCDFGRRLGRYNQAGLAADIAQLQTERVYQTVANDVAAAYYQVLRTRSLHRIARESVRRTEDDRDVAKKLAKSGVVEREKVLRAEVALAQSQRALDVAEEAETMAVAALNLAIGLNVSAATGVVDATDVPSFPLGLADCLQAAVGRREFQVARKSIQTAQVGSRVAAADFAPRILADGSLFDFQQASPRGHADLALGFIKLEWGLFEGGKRVAGLRVADSRIREAMAQADSIADTIAFQVNQTYRQMIVARRGIDRSRPAVEQARETYRLVRARSRQGDATPAELTEAEVGLTRAEQDYANARYDYLTALERLQYAMGTTVTPLTPEYHPATP